MNCVDISCLELKDLEFNSTSIYAINSMPYGRTYSEWTAKWWQWLLSIPKCSSPAFDTTGKNANTNQKDPNVFFLCQTYENADAIPSRSIYVPKNKAIFIPIINWISLLHHDGESDEELLYRATQSMNVVGQMEISINGFTLKKQLEKFRVLSPFFDVDLPEANIVGLSPGIRRAVSDGFWAFIKPLQTGGSLRSFGSCSSGVTRIGVNYEISLA
jgi:hypothetical protein